MPDGRILYALEGDDCFIRLEGDIRYTQSLSFDAFIDRLFDRVRPLNILIDLTAAELIDSTGLGLLAKIARRLLNLRNRRPTLFSTSDDINMLLQSIGFDDVFEMVGRQAAAPGRLRGIEDDRVDKAKLGRTMLEAHRELIRLNEKNRDVFKDVVEMIEKDLSDGGSPDAPATGEHS